MPTDVKNLPQEQSASVADVQPTKQATLIEPSAEAVNDFNNTMETWRPFREKDIRRAPFSSTPEMYAVRIDGSAPELYYKAATGPRKSCTVETVIEAYHPYMAIGQAVVDFMSQCSPKIDEIRIYRRIVKTMKPKK